MVKTESLWSREFIGINAIAFLTYCNIAIFFEFHDYLATLNIPPKQIGFLIALFSISALIIRPIISPMVTDQNSKKWMFTGCCFLIGSLALYNFSNRFLVYGDYEGSPWRNVCDGGNGCDEQARLNHPERQKR